MRKSMSRRNISLDEGNVIIPCFLSIQTSNQLFFLRFRLTRSYQRKVGICTKKSFWFRCLVMRNLLLYNFLGLGTFLSLWLGLRQWDQSQLRWPGREIRIQWRLMISWHLVPDLSGSWKLLLIGDYYFSMNTNRFFSHCCLQCIRIQVWL